MRTAIISIVVLFFNTQCWAQEHDCLKAMRQGDFVYQWSGHNTKISRSDNKQIEHTPTADLKMDIVWESDSTYSLVSYTPKTKEEVRIVCKILFCHGKKYYVHCDPTEAGNEWTGVVEKIE